MRVFFGLMPAFFFISFAKKESRLKFKTEKSCARGNGFYIRARFALCYINANGIYLRRHLLGISLPNPSNTLATFVAVSALKQTQF